MWTLHLSLVAVKRSNAAIALGSRHQEATGVPVPKGGKSESGLDVELVVVQEGEGARFSPTRNLC